MHTTHALHPDVLELTRLLEPGWPTMLAALRASGVPLNEGGDGGAGGDGGQGAGDGAANGADAGKTFSQAELDRIVGERVGRERQKYADYDDLKSKAGRLDEIERANQTEIERVTGDRDSFKGRAETAETQLARYEAAAKAGLDLEHAGRLQGSTPDELEKDAKKLAEALGKRDQTDFDRGPRGGGDRPVDMNAAIRRAAGRPA